MKQSLDLRLGQHLTITPQLQQVIRPLQPPPSNCSRKSSRCSKATRCSTRKSWPKGVDNADTAAPEGADDSETVNNDTDAAQTAAEPTTDPEDSTTESDWAESFELPIASHARTNSGADDDFDVDGRNSLPTTLREHLLWQMQMTPFSAADLAHRRGADRRHQRRRLPFTLSLGDVQHPQQGNSRLNSMKSRQYCIRSRISTRSVWGARTLAECLQLQLQGTRPPRCRTSRKPWRWPPTRIWHCWGTRPRRCGARSPSPEALQAATRLIQSLNPGPAPASSRPPRVMSSPTSSSRKIRGVWRAELNPDISPRLRINHHYERMIQRGNASSSNRYLQDHLCNRRAGSSKA